MKRRADRDLPRAVIAYGLNGTTLHGLVAKFRLVVAFRLFEKVGITSIIVPGEVIRSSFSAKVTIDTLVIDIEFTFLIVFVAIF